MSLAIIWLIVLVVCLVVEISTLGLTSIWFAGGALLALLIAMIGGPLWLQVLVFLVASIVLLIVTRPIAAKYFNKNREKTNVNSKLGKQAIVAHCGIECGAVELRKESIEPTATLLGRIAHKVAICGRHHNNRHNTKTHRL